MREARGGTGRNRPWQAVSEGLEWGDDVGDDQDQAGQLAAEALTDMVVERELQRLRAARASREREPAEWREATGISRAQVWLTAEEARDLQAELREVMLRARRPRVRPGAAARRRPAGLDGRLAGAERAAPGRPAGPDRAVGRHLGRPADPAAS